MDSEDQPVVFNISSTENEALLAADTAAALVMWGLNIMLMPEDLRKSLTQLPSVSLGIACKAWYKHLFEAVIKSISGHLWHSMGQLCEDIKNSCLVDPVSVGGDLDALTRKYSTVLSELLDKHAQLKKRTITLRPAMYNTIRYEKQRRRKFERRWRASGLTAHCALRINCTLINVIWSISAFLMLRWTITPRL